MQYEIVRNDGLDDGGDQNEDSEDDLPRSKFRKLNIDGLRGGHVEGADLDDENGYDAAWSTIMGTTRIVKEGGKQQDDWNM